MMAACFSSLILRRCDSIPNCTSFGAFCGRLCSVDCQIGIYTRVQILFHIVRPRELLREQCGPDDELLQHSSQMPHAVCGVMWLEIAARDEGIGDLLKKRISAQNAVLIDVFSEMRCRRNFRDDYAEQIIYPAL